MDERTLLLELDLPGMVSHDKGCYLGQETVARVHSRGRVNRLLRGLVFDGDVVPAPGSLLLVEDQPVGEVRSSTWSPSLDRPIALAMVRRLQAEPGFVLHVRTGGRLQPATVSALPIYAPPGPGEQAERFFREGLEAFEADELGRALDRFERATLMDPSRYDAFESAGVCLERLGRMPEAIEIMESLTQMDPDNVMAWTNLSRYYAAQGRIEDAEKIKGHVTFLVWKQEAGEQAAKAKAQQADATRKAALVERIPLFEEVLELDPQDVVANFGLGKALVDLERYEEAVPRLRAAIAAQPDYSMAYNHLGTCLIAMGQRTEAVEVLRGGVAAATTRGDFIPKRDMERKLLELERES